MGRLIDTDDIFTNGVFAVDAQNPMKCITELLNRISNAPTAYNVEEVVAELEELKEKGYAELTMLEVNELMDKSIDIVRKGGVE